MGKSISVLISMVGLIHLLPLMGVLGADKLSTAYGLELTDSAQTILLRHRAVLFGLFGAFLLAAAFRPALQPAALAAGFISMASFLWIAWDEAPYGPAIRKVVIADVIGLVLLGIAAILLLLKTAGVGRQG